MVDGEARDRSVPPSLALVTLVTFKVAVIFGLQNSGTSGSAQAEVAAATTTIDNLSLVIGTGGCEHPIGLREQLELSATRTISALFAFSLTDLETVPGNCTWKLYLET